ncbi:uncharacterized protein LOC116663347 [Camelus ferus]|uniref:Uncharacterized protein LOC116663347 n=1 Tax=Camelus ferus TaxID=419612 RepID=A0A8B8SZB6_CAMFR|nr:uncharacterized protein LOC116663347 [Camelus ferus]
MTTENREEGHNDSEPERNTPSGGRNALKRKRATGANPGPRAVRSRAGPAPGPPLPLGSLRPPKGHFVGQAAVSRQRLAALRLSRAKPALLAAASGGSGCSGGARSLREARRWPGGGRGASCPARRRRRRRRQRRRPGSQHGGGAGSGRARPEVVRGQVFDRVPRCSNLPPRRGLPRRRVVPAAAAAVCKAFGGGVCAQPRNRHRVCPPRLRFPRPALVQHLPGVLSCSGCVNGRKRHQCWCAMFLFFSFFLFLKAYFISFFYFGIAGKENQFKLRGISAFHFSFFFLTFFY